MRLRQEIERYGATVEKFVGDAVMAVCGAPVSHEDVPERAYALLGQGRCLRALGRPAAEEPLHEARDLFAETR
jgi:class 3 adenylate cyclase